MQSEYYLDGGQEDTMFPAETDGLSNMFDDDNNDQQVEPPQDVSEADNQFNDEDININQTQQQEHAQDASEDANEDENIYSIKAHKISEDDEGREITKKKNVRKTSKFMNESDNKNSAGFVPLKDIDEGGQDGYNISEDPEMRKRRLLEEKMDLAIKTKSVRRRRADEDDLERMQDERIDMLKDKMIKAANLDVEKNSQGQIATEKLKLLKEVTDILSKADLAISILDNNLLEAVRLWLEPLPDASMPAYQIQKEMILALGSLPIKTDHLVASGIGKVLVFYQRSKRTEPNLKKAVDRLIGDWTRPILNKSDSYKDRSIQFHEYNKTKFTNQLSSARRNKPKEAKTLYEESAERRNRAAIPSARTTAYKIAPRVDPNLLRRQQQLRNGGSNDERFKRINQKLTSMNQKKSTKKTGPSIEGRNLAI